MKKTSLAAILIFCLTGCYTPLNNSGVATTKSWLEVYGKKTDFDGKQYDSCYQFNLHFWPQEAAEQLNLQESCISSCCWRSDKEEVVLDFNKNFDANLAYYGRARKYSPAQITLKVSHSNFVNTTKVTVSPRGSISSKGLVKLTYEEVENPARLAQIEESARRLQARRNAYLIELAQNQAADTLPEEETPPVRKKTAKRKSTKQLAQTASSPAQQAEALAHRQAGAKIDAYFYRMDKNYKKQGALFLLSDRILHPHQTETNGVWSVSCQARARTGLTTDTLKASTFSCGIWTVDLNKNTVTPEDKRAQMIWEE